MGVTGLWSILQPCARPIKIETLNRKRLAVDASIWIYQFLKAVRDKEGNALRNSHVVGFFRRICKLLFFGIKPVFVFDGGAPALKRQTISVRKKRREGRREDAVRTAGRLLAMQMQRRAEEDEERRKQDVTHRQPDREEEEVIPENLVYVEELQMTAQERQQNRQFKKKDAYHLPNLDVNLADMGAPNDPRIMSHEELEEYARQFHTGEDINLYDFSKIDFNGPFFQSLPASDRYNILNAARLRSRLRMGYSKDQLDTMFPDRMAFSRFQVERVQERNELTQRLMNINGMNGEDTFNGGGRVAGEKGKEYVLVKNDGVEGGWALGVVSNKGEGERNKPIDVERFDRPPVPEEEPSEEEDFEDVPVEGLNRLPKRGVAAKERDYNEDYDPDEMALRRRTLYEKRIEAAISGAKSKSDKTKTGPEEVTDDAEESLFLPEEITEQDLEADEEDGALFEDVPPPVDDDDEDLNRAIAMSLEQEDDTKDANKPNARFVDSYKGPRIDMPLDFNQKNAKLGRNFAHLTNARAHGAAPKPFRDDSDEEEDFNLQAALEESRQSMHKPQTGPRVHGFQRPDETSRPAPATPKAMEADVKSPTKPTSSSQDGGFSDGGFSGPLPFESLNLGKSVLGRKKKQVPEEEAGGFEVDGDEEPQTFRKEKSPQPLPPWFTGEIRKATEEAPNEGSEELANGGASLQYKSSFDRGPIARQDTNEVIDLEAVPKKSEGVINVDSSDEDNDGEVLVEDSSPVDLGLRMGDIADKTRAEPPTSSMPSESIRHEQPPKQQPESAELMLPSAEAETNKVTAKPDSPRAADSDEPIEWEESDYETDQAKKAVADHPKKPFGGTKQPEPSMSPFPVFEDVEMPAPEPSPKPSPPPPEEAIPAVPNLPQEESLSLLPADDDNDENYSDPEDEDLLRQLAIEAEEHARFASTLNAKTPAQNAEEYEKELKQLRNQQKKDRRDADEVTHVMVTECQQLLKLFGLPYITAPMEAEAQCAELVSLGLVDGIVTDDSDTFLFGGTRVYKNMFNQAKFVECYLTADLEKEYSLTREKLIGVAHLLGSDYTEGIPSVGPVTALEILSEFEALETFAAWCNDVQLAQKLSTEDSANAFRRKFRKQAQKIFLPAGFPDRRVDAAYLEPEVDSDPSTFEWGVPDLDALRDFLMATIGWTRERTDEVLVPVIRDMNRREMEGTQANITQFFGGGAGVGARQQQVAGKGAGADGRGGFAPRRREAGKSKRMESALGRLHEQARKRTIGEEEDEAEAESSRTSSAANGAEVADGDDGSAQPKKKVKTSRASRKRAKPTDDEDEDEDDGDASRNEDVDGDREEVYAPPKKAKKKSATATRAGRPRGKK
ncbi:MAG: hypothetical protein L6R37_006232 [Teloschistes peruensis]|nr:MAG: hypothetical protein L6R37_006232 [Teloschistes peruensis]